MSSPFAAPGSVSFARRSRRTGRGTVRLMLLLVLAFVVANLVGGARGLTAFRDATSAFATLSEAVEGLRQENESLRQQARRLREDSAAIENLARKEMGLIRPGEKVFILRDQPREQ